jgi:hypothetical protein
MARTKTFRVENGRMLFKCHACQGTRLFAVAPGVRMRSVRCAKCGETTRCIFNRRHAPRELQSGKILARTADGKELAVDLSDISPDGIGFEIAFRDAVKIAVGRDLQLKCTWNPHLLGQERYVVRSVIGQRVGVERRK